MKVLRRLVRNGGSTQISIPAEMLAYLGWKPGDPIVVELGAAKTIGIREPRLEDIRAPSAPMVLDARLPERTP